MSTAENAKRSKLLVQPLAGITIAVDFDGTCVTHAFPDLGEDIGAAPVLKGLALDGAKLLLWTMRDSSRERDYLKEAVNWFAANKIPLIGVNQNPDQTWTTSPKAYAHYYIDDAAVGAPLIYPPGERPYIHWGSIDEFFLKVREDRVNNLHQ